MITVAPDPPPAPENAVDRPRDTNREPGHSTRQRRLVVGLDQQVNVISLHGEVQDTKPCAVRRSDGAPHGDEHGLAS